MSSLDQNSVLRSFKFDMPNYNILVISRITLSGYSFTYNLKPLNDEDATTLLHHSASLQDGSSHISVEVIKKVLCKCDTYRCNVLNFIYTFCHWVK